MIDLDHPKAFDLAEASQQRHQSVRIDLEASSAISEEVFAERRDAVRSRRHVRFHVGDYCLLRQVAHLHAGDGAKRAPEPAAAADLNDPHGARTEYPGYLGRRRVFAFNHLRHRASVDDSTEDISGVSIGITGNNVVDAEVAAALLAAGKLPGSRAAENHFGRR